jgi:hypothetical protein
VAQTKDEFGFFLAGLIDADGHIAKLGYVQIDFIERLVLRIILENV